MKSEDCVYLGTRINIKKRKLCCKLCSFFKEIKQNGSEPDGKIEGKKEKSFSVECCRILKPRNKFCTSGSLISKSVAF